MPKKIKCQTRKFPYLVGVSSHAGSVSISSLNNKSIFSVCFLLSAIQLKFFKFLSISLKILHEFSTELVRFDRPLFTYWTIFYVRFRFTFEKERESIRFVFISVACEHRLNSIFALLFEALQIYSLFLLSLGVSWWRSLLTDLLFSCHFFLRHVHY